MQGDLTRSKSNKGSADGQFSAEILHRSLWKGRLVSLALAGLSSSRLFRDEGQHPWRTFFGHGRKPPGSTTGGDPWEGRSAADLNGTETIGGILCWKKGKDTRHLFA